MRKIILRILISALALSLMIGGAVTVNALGHRGHGRLVDVDADVTAESGEGKVDVTEAPDKPERPEQPEKPEKPSKPERCEFVDADGDGVCDTCKGESRHCGKKPERPEQPSKPERCEFVDADGDGVCDTCKGEGRHCDEKPEKPATGRGNSRCKGRGCR